MKNDKVEILKTLRAMAEIFGKDLSEVALDVFISQLSYYPSEHVLTALKLCLRELRVFPSVADVLNRIKTLDGRLGVEEAWALLPKREEESVVWTEESAEGFGAVHGLIVSGDLIAARMAFKEVYDRAVDRNRNEGRPAKWSVSLGHNKAGRASALIEAAQKGRISLEDARRYMPEIESFSVGQKTMNLPNFENRKELPAGMSSVAEIANKALEKIQEKKDV